MDRFNLNNYRQQSRGNPQSSTTPGGHTASHPVASTSKLPPLSGKQPVQNGQLYPSGEQRVEQPQTGSSSHHVSYQQSNDSHTQRASFSTPQHHNYWPNAAYTQAQAQAAAQLHYQQEIQRQRQAEVQRHYQQLGWERYLSQNQQQYHQQLQQQVHQEQHHQRRSSNSEDASVAHTHTTTSAPLDSSSNTLASSSTPSTLTTSSTVILPPIPKVDSDSSSKPSPIPPPGLISQLSELVAQKVFEAMERAGIVSSELNGKGKGKERATDTSGSSDTHIPVNPPHQSSNEQPDTHMMLLVQVIKEMKQDVRGVKDVLVGCEEGSDSVGVAKEGGQEKGVVVVLDHSDEEDSGVAPTLGSWRTRLDKKRKDRHSNKWAEKAFKEPRGMLQRLESLEMDVQELLERLRDPLAGIDDGGVFLGTGRRQQEGLRARIPEPQPQPQREPSLSRVTELGLPLTQQRQPTIIDLTSSPSRDGTEGVGDIDGTMFVDVDDNVAHLQKHQVDENENARNTEQELDRSGKDDQAMDFVGDKSGDVDGMCAVRTMQVDEEATPNAEGDADDVFGPLTPNSLDGSKSARSGVLSPTYAASENSVGVRASTSTTIKTTSSSSSVPQLHATIDKGLEVFAAGEQRSHSSEQTPPSPQSGSEDVEATKLKIRLSPKVTLVVESPPRRQTSVLSVDPTTIVATMTKTTETDALTSTPQRAPARSATPPPGFSPVDWSKVSNASRSRSGSAGKGVMSMTAKRSLRGTSSSSSSSPSLLSPTKITSPLSAPWEIQKFVPTCSSSKHSTPLRRPSEDSIAALRMEAHQSPRVSPGMIVLEGSTSVGEIGEGRKRGTKSPLGMSRSASETSPPPTKAQTPVAPGMGATVSTNSVLTSPPATKAAAEAFSSPKVAPSTSLMSVDSPSQPAQTFGDAEDVPSPSPALIPRGRWRVDYAVPQSLRRHNQEEKKVQEEKEDEDEEGDEEEEAAKASMQVDEEESPVEVGDNHQEEVNEEVGEEVDEVSMQLDSEEGTVGAADEPQEEVDSDEEEEEGVTGPSEEANSSNISIVAYDKDSDEYVEEERSVEKTDEDEEEPLIEEEEGLQREVDELREGVDEDEEEVVSVSRVEAVNSSPSASQSASQTGFRSSSPSDQHHSSPASSSPNAYSSSPVSSITVNPNEVDLGKVRFGPPKKVPKVSAPELSQSTTATADDCEAVVQSLMEDVEDNGAAAAAAAAIWFALTAKEEEDEAAAHASAPNSNQVAEGKPAEPSSEEEADNLSHSFEGAIPADDIDESEDQEDSNLGHTFQNGAPADEDIERVSESPHAVSHHSQNVGLQSALAVTPRQQTKSSLLQGSTPMIANPKTPQRHKSPEYIFVPSRSSSPVKKTSRELGKEKETEKEVKTEKIPVISLDSSDDEEIIITGRLKRGRPPATRPILTKAPLKLDVFEGPGPIGTSTPVQKDIPFPQFPLSSVVDASLNSEPPKTPKRTVEPPSLDHLSPMSDLTPSPKPAMRELTPPDSPPFDPKKHAALMDDDDDTEIRPIKKKRKASAATTSSVGSEMNMKLDPDQPSANAPRPKKRLLVIPKKGQSTAMTRVKKRKVIPEPDDDDEDDEPPLKKAKLRRSVRSSETSASSNSRESSKGKEKERTRERLTRTSSKGTLSPARNGKPPKGIKTENSPVKKTPTRRPRGLNKKVAVVWPTCATPNYDQHLQCDMCHDWYHIGCVGIETGDIRLDETEIYTCPRCDAGYNEEMSPSKKKKLATTKSSTSKCARPDCQVNIEPDGIFEVEAIVGMSGTGTSALYLVKWHNYGFDEVTIQTLESMELSDPRILLETFYKAAKAEGLQLKTRKNEYVILKAAAAAGWNSHGEFVKSES